MKLASVGLLCLCACPVANALSTVGNSKIGIGSSATVSVNYNPFHLTSHNQSQNGERIKMRASSALYMSSSSPLRRFKQPSSSSKSSLSSTVGMNEFNTWKQLPSPKMLMLELIHKLRNLNEVGKWRVAAATFVSSLFMFSSQLDLQLVKLWSWLQNDTTALLPRLFRHDHGNGR